MPGPRQCRGQPGLCVSAGRSAHGAGRAAPQSVPFSNDLARPRTAVAWRATAPGDYQRRKTRFGPGKTFPGPRRLMLHAIKTQKLGPFAGAMAGAVQACVHCGFCLAACPTYGELGQEMDTPRGRIVLMKRVLEEDLPWEAAQPHIDRCLGCLACEPACPSGVQYRDLINPYRVLSKPRVSRSATESLGRAIEALVL